LPNQILYFSPGCGDDAVPVCREVAMDMNAAGFLACGCDGKTFLASQVNGQFLYASKPLRALGCCPGDTSLFCPAPDAGGQ
jgi:hypothetical protein